MPALPREQIMGQNWNNQMVRRGKSNTRAKGKNPSLHKLFVAHDYLLG
jgi:hypothetical protein